MVSKSPPIILLDMDEVLADFVGGALRTHGWTRERLEQVWPVGTWSIVEPMGLTVEEFWQPIDVLGEAFWLGLQPLPWARGLLRMLDAVGSPWWIVSSPSMHPGCYSGKIRWLRRLTGNGFSHLVLTGSKELLARPEHVLMDDREETVQRFVKTGGQGVVFPSRHNCCYGCASDPVVYLTRLFNQERDNALSFQKRQRRFCCTCPWDRGRSHSHGAIQQPCWGGTAG